MAGWWVNIIHLYKCVDSLKYSRAHLTKKKLSQRHSIWMFVQTYVHVRVYVQYVCECLNACNECMCVYAFSHCVSLQSRSLWAQPWWGRARKAAMVMMIRSTTSSVSEPSTWTVIQSSPWPEWPESARYVCTVCMRHTHTHTCRHTHSLNQSHTLAREHIRTEVSTHLYVDTHLHIVISTYRCVIVHLPINSPVHKYRHGKRLAPLVHIKT